MAQIHSNTPWNDKTDIRWRKYGMAQEGSISGLEKNILNIGPNIPPEEGQYFSALKLMAKPMEPPVGHYYYERKSGAASGCVFLHFKGPLNNDDAALIWTHNALCNVYSADIKWTTGICGLQRV
ncbi:hypothetical protein AAHD62_02985 [Enterobacter hormaechei]